MKSRLGIACPKLDDDILSRLKDLATFKPTIAREKVLYAIQRRQLDALQPLIEAYEIALLKHYKFLEKQLMAAIRLWAQAFFEVTTQRRENVLVQTDPKLVCLLKKRKSFKPRQVGDLFGGRALKHLYKMAKRDKSMR